MNIRIAQALGSLVAAAALLGAAHADTVLLSEAAYPEGPLWRDGKLLYVEYAGPGIKMWDGKRTVAYWSGEHCGASGLIAYRGDHILVACYDANTVVELDRTGKQIRAFELRPKTILEFMERADAFRRPERFTQALLACEADSRGRTGLENVPYPQRGYLQAARDAAAAIKPSTEEITALSGAKIAEHLHRRRAHAIFELRQRSAANDHSAR